MFSKIRIILVETTHPGNIGAAARAMKNMGLKQLYLVKPKIFPDADAIARAAGADDLLAKAMVVDDLNQALSGCHLVIGTSARLRSLPLPLLTPKECAQEVLATGENSEVAIVFGREDSGLNNDELYQCHYHVNIPTVKDFSSLNLAAAVQVIVYEIYAAQAASSPGLTGGSRLSLATADELELFYQHLRQVLVNIKFLGQDHPRKMMYRLRRLFNRAKLEKTEINILRGILSAINNRG